MIKADINERIYRIVRALRDYTGGAQGDDYLPLSQDRGEAAIKLLLSDFLAAVIPPPAFSGLVSPLEIEAYDRGNNACIDTIKANAEMLLKGETE